MFLGLFQRSAATLRLMIRCLDANGEPAEPDSAPRVRAWGSSSTEHDATASSLVSLSVTGASNASPIVITAASHGLQTGMRVTISGVGGNTAANGTFTITKVSSNTFSLDGSTGNGAYTAGGTVKRTGLYTATITASDLSAAVTAAIVTYAVSSVTKAVHYRFVLY